MKIKVTSYICDDCIWIKGDIMGHILENGTACLFYDKPISDDSKIEKELVDFLKKEIKKGKLDGFNRKYFIENFIRKYE